MPEPDRLEKLIEQRKQQERKNDKLRVHKNKIECDRLKAQSAYFEWYKELRQREFESKEGEYMRKLERIYDRQLQIEEGRRRVEEKKEEKRAIIRQRRASVEQNVEAMERERRKQMHGMKQERAKSFMSKARLLCTGYRDNDPPQAYYKRNGLVPPDRFVTPEMTANAQASFGGGSRPPASSEHLYKQNMLPRETPFGVTVPDHLRRDSARGRLDSAVTRSDRPSVATDDGLLDSDDELIDEVIRVQVKLRPSTAPGQRKARPAKKLPESGVITEISGETEETDQVVSEEGGSQVEDAEQRPSTAMATVRFTEESTEKAPSEKRPQNARRRSSIRPQSMMMFRRRSQSSSGSAATPGGGRSASSTPRGGQRGAKGAQQPQLMSNAEQERIRRKMREKAICLESERIKRAYIAETGITPRGRRPASASPRFLANVAAWRAANMKEQRAETAQSKRRRTDEHREAMLKYMRRCERGEIFGDSLEAQHILLSATQRHLERLQGEVCDFVRK